MVCINVNTKYIKNPLSIAIQMLDTISIKTDNLNESLHVKTRNITTVSNIYCYRICSITQSGYLDVIPNIVWLTPDMLNGTTFDIYSNVAWKID